jgi:hypothetical protein
MTILDFTTATVVNLFEQASSVNKPKHVVQVTVFNMGNTERQ